MFLTLYVYSLLEDVCVCVCLSIGSLAFPPLIISSLIFETLSYYIVFFLNFL